VYRPDGVDAISHSLSVLQAPNETPLKHMMPLVQSIRGKDRSHVVLLLILSSSVICLSIKIFAANLLCLCLFCFTCLYVAFFCHLFIYYMIYTHVIYFTISEESQVWALHMMCHCR